MRVLTAALTFLLACCSPGLCPARSFHVEQFVVVATAYSWREPDHHRFGRLNCEGGILDDTQVAADTRYYPLGTVLWIEGIGRRTVTDRGSAIIGTRHLDIHFDRLSAMRAWGKRIVRVRVLHRP